MMRTAFSTKRLKMTVPIVMLLSIGFLSLFIGALDLSPRSEHSEAWHILRISRLPRLIAIILTGASLAISGLIMQKVSRNRFVSPSTAVTMDAARMGILLAMVLFPKASLFHKALCAFIFSLLGSGFFITLLSQIPLKNAVFIPLLGMMIGSVLDSFTTFIALKYDLMQALGTTLTGSFTYIMQGRYELLYLTAPLLLIAISYTRQFDILALGDDFATGLGIHTQKIAYLGITIVSLLSASVVVTVGTLPFIGLIVPNVVTKLYGDSSRTSILYCGLYGALLLLICDVMARLVIYPYELPVGFILGIVGAISFIVMLRHEI